MTPDLLARLDAEETRLLTELAEVRAAKATLRRVCGVVDAPHGPTGFAETIRATVPEVFAPVPAAARVTPPPAPPEGSPGKPEPRPATVSASGNRPGRKPDTTLPPRVAAAMLGGPKRMKDLEAACGATGPKIGRVLNANPHLFRQADPTNRLSPWELTEAGRVAAG